MLLFESRVIHNFESLLINQGLISLNIKMSDEEKLFSILIIWIEYTLCIVYKVLQTSSLNNTRLIPVASEMLKPVFFVCFCRRLLNSQNLFIWNMKDSYCLVPPLGQNKDMNVKMCV